MGVRGKPLLRSAGKSRQDITILNSLSSRTRDYIQEALKCTNVKVRVGDCEKLIEAGKAKAKGDVIYDLAANPEVRLELTAPSARLRDNADGSSSAEWRRVLRTTPSRFLRFE